MAAEIFNRGRGPEIRDTRITVYDVMEYYLHDWPREDIATLLRLTAPELGVAISYIEEHRAELIPIYRKMLDRAQRGNPPKVEALLAGSRERLMARKRELESRSASAAGAANGIVAG